MPYGLAKEDLTTIRQVVQRFPVVEQVILFGSRAKGNYKPGSDIDLAIKGSHIDHDISVKLAEILNEETMLPYFFNIVHYDLLTEQRLIQHIDRIGITL